jgi:hypothetical protein
MGLADLQLWAESDTPSTGVKLGCVCRREALWWWTSTPSMILRTAPPAVHQDAETKLAALGRAARTGRGFSGPHPGATWSQCPNNHARGGPHYPQCGSTHPPVLGNGRAAGEMVSKDGQIDSHIRAVTLGTIPVKDPRTSDISAVRTYSAVRAGLGPGGVIHPTSFPDASRGRGFRHALGGSIA